MPSSLKPGNMLPPLCRHVWLIPFLALGFHLPPQPPTLAAPPTPRPQISTPPLQRQGNQILLNNRPYPVAWTQWPDPQRPGQMRTGLSDGGLRGRLGFDLLNTSELTQQPVQWFSDTAVFLKPHFSPSGNYRYLDITELANQMNWQLQVQGNQLQILSPPAQIQNLRLGRQSWGDRIVIDLDRPTPWRLSRLTNSRDGRVDREFELTVDAIAAPELGQLSGVSGPKLKKLQSQTAAKQFKLQGVIAGSLQPQVSMLANPTRLVVDLRPEPTNSRDILWAPGVRWREDVLQLGQHRFPVTWLAIDPRQPGLKLRPLWSDPQSLVGLQPVPAIAQRWQAAAAINGGFFNRDKQTPLGAIRTNHTWISSPILNRGAIAWDAAGNFKLGRLTTQETLTTSTNQRLAITALDSGFAQQGIARYTRNWGATYTPLLQQETIVSVQRDQITTVRQSTGNTAFPIPSQGYLLVLRNLNPGTALTPGTRLQLQMSVTPSEFQQFPEILGAGPLLLENGRIVLNAKGEQFRPPFDTQAAPRSGIGQTRAGTVLMATVHNRVGGAGPTLLEWAQLMQQLGAINALNLDGGSSTTLYLGGQLLDRHPTTLTKVQNTLGLFFQPLPQTATAN